MKWKERQGWDSETFFFYNKVLENFTIVAPIENLKKIATKGYELGTRLLLLK